MADYYISSANPIGTKTSGASTANDWSASNCYPLLTATIVNLMVDGDSIIYNDGTHDHVAQIAIGGGLAAGAKTLTFKGRYGSASDAMINGTDPTPTGALFAVNPGGGSGKLHTCIFEDLSFKISIPSTASGGCLFTFSGDAEDQTFTRCIFTDISHTSTTTSTNGHLFHPTTSTNNRTITFTDCVFSNITTSSIERPTIIGISAANNDLVMTGITFNNISHTYTAGSKAGGGEGYMLNNFATANMTISDTTFSDCSLNGDDATTVKSLIVSSPSGGTSTFTGVTATRITKTGTAGGSQAILFVINNAADTTTIENCHASHSTNLFNGNSIGGLVTSIGTSTVTRITNSSAHHNTGFYGAVLDGSAGGTIIASGCTGYMNDGGAAGSGSGGNDINGVDFYSGGSGDYSLTSCVSYGSKANGTAAGHSVFIMNNTTTGPTRDKVVALQNCTFGTLHADAGAAISVIDINNDNATSSLLTVNMTNCVVRGGSDIDIKLTDNGTSLLDVNMIDCFYEIAPVDTGITGTLTNTRGSTDDPLFISVTDYNLQSTSPCVGAGTQWWGTDPRPDTLGEPLPDRDIDIGAYQSTHSPLHPVNL